MDISQLLLFNTIINTLWTIATLLYFAYKAWSFIKNATNMFTFVKHAIKQLVAFINKVLLFFFPKIFTDTNIDERADHHHLTQVEIGADSVPLMDRSSLHVDEKFTHNIRRHWKSNTESYTDDYLKFSSFINSSKPSRKETGKSTFFMENAFNPLVNQALDDINTYKPLLNNHDYGDDEYSDSDEEIKSNTNNGNHSLVQVWKDIELGKQSHTTLSSHDHL